MCGSLGEWLSYGSDPKPPAQALVRPDRPGFVVGESWHFHSSMALAPDSGRGDPGVAGTSLGV